MADVTVRGILPTRPTQTARLLFWPVLVAALAAFALEARVWTVEESFSGPFAREKGASGIAYAIPIGRDRPFACCLDIRGDDNSYPDQSDLRLWVGGRQMGPAHTLHDAIRNSDSLGYSHWGDYVLFRLPAGVENTPPTLVTARYSLRLPRGSAFLLLATSLILGLFGYRDLLPTLRRRSSPAVGLALRIPCWALRILGYAGLIAATIYMCCTLVALMSGWALPTTALIRWSESAKRLALFEPRLGYVLLTVAALGAAARWVAPLLHVQHLARDEAIAGRFLRRWGFLITICLFVFSMSAPWSGMPPRDGDIARYNVGGLVPFSDAGAYLAASYDQAKDGIWNPYALRRPLAAAFRSMLLFAGNYSFPTMLLIQQALMSISLCAATGAVARWRGLWAGIAFYALAFIYMRAFAPTALTEPLGLIWALIAIPFFIEALRNGAFGHAVIAFGAMTVALMTRMGSMFTIPALALWMTIEFATTAKQRLRVVVICTAVGAGIFGVNAIVERAYGTGQVLTGSNVSYTLCGLTIGQTWSGCLDRLQAEGKALPRSESARPALLYSMAWDNFQRDPSVLFARLGRGVAATLFEMPKRLLLGYVYLPKPPNILIALWESVVGIGLLLLLWKRPARREVSFWVLLWASVLASGAFVIFDDGGRTLAVSFPLLWLFAASGFSSLMPPRATGEDRMKCQIRAGAIGCTAAALLLIGTPWLAYQFDPGRDIRGSMGPLAPTEHVILGGTRMTGFLVVADDAALRHDVPTIHLSAFADIVRASGIEEQQGLLHPRMPDVPFGFVFAPLVEAGPESYIKYVVPPEVIERRDVWAWRIQVKDDWQTKPGLDLWWLKVERADPLP